MMAKRIAIYIAAFIFAMLWLLYDDPVMDRELYMKKMYPSINVHEMMSGVGSYDKKTINSVIDNYTASAAKGSMTSRWMLGWYYAYGFGVPRDSENSRSYFEQTDYYNLGYVFLKISNDYKSGRGVVEINLDEAAFWYIAAMEHANHLSMAPQK